MTRRLVLTQNVTLDGVVDMSAGWFDPNGAQAADPEHLALNAEQMSAETGLLLGRQTFTDFRGYWPLQTDDTTGVTAHLNSVAKTVVSSTLTDPGWENSTVLDPSSTDLATAVRSLVDGGSGDICVTGSISLSHELLRAGVIDEVRTFTYPVVVGAGRRLFPDGVTGAWEPADTRRFGNGIVFAAYRRA